MNLYTSRSNQCLEISALISSRYAEDESEKTQTQNTHIALAYDLKDMTNKISEEHFGLQSPFWQKNKKQKNMSEGEQK